MFQECVALVRMRVCFFLAPTTLPSPVASPRNPQARSATASTIGGGDSDSEDPFSNSAFAVGSGAQEQNVSGLVADDPFATAPPAAEDADALNESAADAMAAALTAITPPPGPPAEEEAKGGPTFLDNGELVAMDDIPTLSAPADKVRTEGRASKAGPRHGGPCSRCVSPRRSLPLVPPSRCRRLSLPTSRLSCAIRATSCGCFPLATRAARAASPTSSWQSTATPPGTTERWWRGAWSSFGSPPLTKRWPSSRAGRPPADARESRAAPHRAAPGRAVPCIFFTVHTLLFFFRFVIS